MATREIKDMPHEYLVECVQLLEGYMATMLQMILDHHPYMGAPAEQIGRQFKMRHAELESRYPISQIVTPGNGLIKPH